MCPRVTKLLHHMYTNQSCYVKWGNEHTDSFSVPNDVKQEGVISALLFSCYIDTFFSQLQHSGLGCHVGTTYAGATGNKLIAESGRNRFYAISLPITHKDILVADKWTGKSKLGEILMKVRREIGEKV